MWINIHSDAAISAMDIQRHNMLNISKITYYWEDCVERMSHFGAGTDLNACHPL